MVLIVHRGYLSLFESWTTGFQTLAPHEVRWVKRDWSQTLFFPFFCDNHHYSPIIKAVQSIMQKDNWSEFPFFGEIFYTLIHSLTLTFNSKWFSVAYTVNQAYFLVAKITDYNHIRWQSQVREMPHSHEVQLYPHLSSYESTCCQLSSLLNSLYLGVFLRTYIQVLDYIDKLSKKQKKPKTTSIYFVSMTAWNKGRSDGCWINVNDIL